jgi:hypothetical protein
VLSLSLSFSIVRIPGIIAHALLPVSNDDLVRNKEKQEEYEIIGPEAFYAKHPPNGIKERDV